MHQRGCWIVGVAFYAEAVTIGLTIIPFGLFALPIANEFGASMSSFQLGRSKRVKNTSKCREARGRAASRSSSPGSLPRRARERARSLSTRSRENPDHLAATLGTLHLGKQVEGRHVARATSKQSFAEAPRCPEVGPRRLGGLDPARASQVDKPECPSLPEREAGQLAIRHIDMGAVVT